MLYFLTAAAITAVFSTVCIIWMGRNRRTASDSVVMKTMVGLMESRQFVYLADRRIRGERTPTVGEGFVCIFVTFDDSGDTAGWLRVSESFISCFYMEGGGCDWVSLLPWVQAFFYLTDRPTVDRTTQLSFC